ncbi:MAG: hypothetical protein KKB34_12615 [Bacteroidetes bacterium]|nr:hypothetical protein [Bacteroidota bacterium]
MKTLVYFASGNYQEVYQKLHVDKIFLIDDCFKRRIKTNTKIENVGNVTCIGMDCLEAVDYLKQQNVKIDYFVSLNEGLYEGGGRYAINSDTFIGYAMPLFKDKYIHIMNKEYYNKRYNVSMDLPYRIEELDTSSREYISPFVFSKAKYHEGHAKVFRMQRINDSISIDLGLKINLTIKHNSIWNDYDELDLLVITFLPNGTEDFFKSQGKVINLRKNNLNAIFRYCKFNKISKMGITPWRKGNYKEFIETLQKYEYEYPKEIILYHLNKDDYNGIKNLC